MAIEVSRVSTRIGTPPASVWRALTTPSTLKQFFFGADVRTDWRVGAPIRFIGEWKGKSFEDKGVVRTVDAERRLAFTHWSAMSGMEDKPENYHVVTFDLTPEDGATRVVLTQTNQNEAEPVTEKSRAELDKNWTMVLAGLKKVVEG